jgi:hypothetical protein
MTFGLSLYSGKALCPTYETELLIFPARMVTTTDNIEGKREVQVMLSRAGMLKADFEKGG